MDMPEIIKLQKSTSYLKIGFSAGAKLDTHVGLHGDAGVFSFYPVKHLTTAEGGIIILKDSDLAKN